MINTIICTVGTSLFYSNLSKIGIGLNDKPSNWKKLKEAFDNEKWKLLAKLFQDINPSERICGAEINTIEESIKKKSVNLERIVFLVSESEIGINTGEFLKYYYKQRQDLNLKEVSFQIIEGLQDHEPKKFKSTGLRNLVKIIGSLVNRLEPKGVAIDATGGYKAQIAIAVLIGQALNIPVYYKHERFNEIIDFPAMPISLDFDLLGENADILTALEAGSVLQGKQLQIDERLLVFFDSIQEENQTLHELNPVGQLYLTTFRLRYPKTKNLPNLDADGRTSPTFGDDHHYPNGFKDFVNKVWNENKWIKTCWSTSYHGQKSIKGIGFRVKNSNDTSCLEGEFKEKDFGARFEIQLSVHNRENLNWAAEYLNRKYQ